MTLVHDFGNWIFTYLMHVGLLRKKLRGHGNFSLILKPNQYDRNVLLSAGRNGRLLIWNMDSEIAFERR